jgi:copper chaperone
MSAGWEIVMGKRFAIILVGLAVWLVPTASSACDDCAQGAHHAQAAAATKAASAQLGPGEVRVRIPVAGMTCGHCVSRVEAALAKLEGVRLAEASVERGEAVVVFEKTKLAPAKLVETIDALGYKAGTPAQN